LRGILSHVATVPRRGTLRNLRLATAGNPANHRNRLLVHCLPVQDGLGWSRLEKRSQALQGCNLTRNIQVDRCADGASPGGCHPARGLLLTPHRTPELCLENPPSQQQATSSFSMIPVLWCGLRVHLRVIGQSSKSPKHLSGALPAEAHEDR